MRRLISFMYLLKGHLFEARHLFERGICKVILGLKGTLINLNRSIYLEGALIWKRW